MVPFGGKRPGTHQEPETENGGHTTFCVKLAEWPPNDSGKGWKRNSKKYIEMGDSALVESACNSLRNLETEEKVTRQVWYWKAELRRRRHAVCGASSYVVGVHRVFWVTTTAVDVHPSADAQPESIWDLRSCWPTLASEHLYCELKLNKTDECALQILRPCMQLTLHCAYMGYIPSSCKFGLDQ